MILSDREIRGLVEYKGLISDFVDIEMQLQPAGFDLTLDSIQIIKPGEWGRLDFSNNERIIPHCYDVPKENGGWALAPGTYILKSKEKVNLPNGISGLAWPRSSLNRCGAFLNSATIDPGYSGSLSFLLQVLVSLRLEDAARFAQIIFVRTHLSEKLYGGIYKEKST